MRFKRLKNEILYFFLPATSDLSSERTVFDSASSCAPPFKNTVPFFLVGDHPVYQRSSMLRLARTQRMFGSRISKRILEGSLGRRPAGKPRNGRTEGRRQIVRYENWASIGKT